MNRSLVAVVVLSLSAASLAGCSKGNPVESVKAALAAKGLAPTGSRALSDRLGNLPECTFVERLQLDVPGGSVKLGNYGDASKAEACWNAFAGKGANMSFYVRKGAWIGEIHDRLPADAQQKVKDALSSAL